MTNDAVQTDQPAAPPDAPSPLDEILAAARATLNNAEQFAAEIVDAARDVLNAAAQLGRRYADAIDAFRDELKAIDRERAALTDRAGSQAATIAKSKPVIEPPGPF